MQLKAEIKKEVRNNPVLGSLLSKLLGGVHVNTIRNYCRDDSKLLNQTSVVFALMKHFNTEDVSDLYDGVTSPFRKVVNSSYTDAELNEELTENPVMP